MELKKINILDAENMDLYDDETGFFRIIIQNVYIDYFKEDGTTARVSLDRVSTSKDEALMGNCHFAYGTPVVRLRSFTWNKTLYYNVNPYGYNHNREIQKVTDYSVVIEIAVYKLNSNLENHGCNHPDGKLEIEVKNKNELLSTYFYLYERKYKLVHPNICDLKIDKSFYYELKGKVTVTKVYDNSISKICEVETMEDEEISITYDNLTNLFYLPYDEVPASPFEVLNKCKREIDILPFLGYSEGIYNIYWKKIDLAFSYIVSVYKIIEVSAGVKELYHLKDISVDRNTFYISIDKLIGGNFVFKVLVENREGEIIAESKGLYSNVQIRPVPLAKPKAYNEG